MLYIHSPPIGRALASRIPILLCIYLLLPTPAAGQTSSDVPLSHTVYDLLDRLESRGIFGHTLCGIRPYSRSYISVLLESSMDSGILTKSEAGRITRVATEFGDASVKTRLDGLLDARFYEYSDSVLEVRVNPILRQRLHMIRDNGDEDTVSQTYIGLGVHGSLHDIFAFRVQHFEAREWSNISRTDRSEVWASPIETVQVKGQIVDFRETRFQLSARLPWFSLDVGKEGFDWGPSREANLFLHNAGPSFVYARGILSYKALTFQHLFGAIRTPVDAISLGTTTISNGHRRTIPPSKRFVSHRLELEMTERFRVGLHESVVYGDRGFEPAYAVPVSILLGAQTYAGETDNLAFGADVTFLVAKDIKLFGALFFDDLQKFTPGSFSNQIGAQFGTHWVNPFGVKNTDIRFEFAHIEPYTYAHNFDINAYTHFGDVLGYPLGPNSDRLFTRLQWWPTAKLSFWAEASRSRAGDNYLSNTGELVNVGGDASQGRRPKDASTKDFLAGDLTTTTDLRLGARVDVSAALGFEVEYHRNQSERVPAEVGIAIDWTSSSNKVGLFAELNAF